MADSFYAGKFDVQSDVNYILTGMISTDSAVLSHIPHLLTEYTECDVGKLKVSNAALKENT